MKHVTLIGMLAVVLVAALAVPAQAVIIHRADWSGNITSTRFFDDFEDGAHNSYSAANIGAWSGAPKVSTIQEGGTLLSFSGDKFGSQNPNMQNDLVFPQINSGIFKFSTMINIKNAYENGYEFLIELRDSGGGAAGLQLTRTAGDIFRAHNGATGLNLQGTFNHNTWHRIDIVYPIGSGSMEIGLNGVFTSMLTKAGTLGDIAAIRFKNTSNNSRWYVDDIPEPSTVGLMAIGCLAMLRRRRLAG